MAALDFPSSPTDGQTYTSGTVTWSYSSAKTAWVVLGTGISGYTGSAGYTGSSGTSPAQLKTSAATVNFGDVIAANTFTAAFSLSLPATPTTGQLPIVFFDAGANSTFDGFATNNLTVLRNSSATINGVADDVYFAIKGISVTFEYMSSGWRMR
jgi:hypothetical protein